MIDLTYIDSAVAAVEAVMGAPTAALGQKFNISNGEPVAMWPLIQQLSARLGYPPLRRRASGWAISPPSP